MRKNSVPIREPMQESFLPPFRKKSRKISGEFVLFHLIVCMQKRFLRRELFSGQDEVL